MATSNKSKTISFYLSDVAVKKLDEMVAAHPRFASRSRLLDELLSTGGLLDIEPEASTKQAEVPRPKLVEASAKQAEVSTD